MGVVTIGPEMTAQDDHETHPLTDIARLATDMGVSDLSTNHSHYAHGQVSDEPRRMDGNRPSFRAALLSGPDLSVLDLECARDLPRDVEP